MPKQNLRDCIFEGLMEIKKMERRMIFWRTIDSDIPFASSFLAGWIKESIKNQTVEIEELREEKP